MRLLPLVLALLPIAPLTAAEPLARIAKFPGDRAAAISYTFDDGLRDQVEIAAPLLERFGFHGTFFLVTSVIPDSDEEAAAKAPGKFGGAPWSAWRKLADAGHEIGNHSYSHKQMTKLSDEELAQEIDWASAAILEKIGRRALTFCYPGNGRNDHVRDIVLKTHVASRDNLKGFGKPDFTAEQANAWAEELVQKHEWGVAMIHGIVAGYDAFSSPKVLEDHFAFVAGRKNDICVDTFANLARYETERKQAKLDATFTDQSAKITLTTDLDSGIYTIPLTCVVEIQGVTSAVAKRGNATLPVTVKSDQILVDLVPGSEPVIVTWTQK